MSHSLDDGHWEICSTLEVRYEVRNTIDVLNPENSDLIDLHDGGGTHRGTRVVVIDHNVMEIYGTKIESYLQARRIPYRLVPLSGGEQNKTMGQVLQIISVLNDVGTLRQSEPPIAIGGGVLLDVVGLAVSLYRRGIPHVRVPTTLLSLVDVSVAAKTGVNFQGFRNRIGSYSPAPLTLVDNAFLTTLSRRHISNGAGEILKLGMIKDAALFELLENEGPRLVAEKFFGSPGAQRAIRLAITDMIEELRENLWEKDLQRIVDYGHSFSPLVEMRYIGELLHGEAVALDCILSAIIAQGRGFLDHGDLQRILRTTAGLGLPVWHRGFGDPDLLARALEDTTRHRNGNQNLPIMTGIGQSIFIKDVTFDEIVRATKRMEQLTVDFRPAGLIEHSATL